MFVLKADELKLKGMRRQLGELSVDECVMLAQQADAFLVDMPVFDPAWTKFTSDSRLWWQYAWLLACETDTVNTNAEYVKAYDFVVAFPRLQQLLGQCDFRDWVRTHKADEIITMEFCTYLPTYLRDSEVNLYAVEMFHAAKEISGRLRQLEIERL